MAKARHGVNGNGAAATKVAISLVSAGAGVAGGVLLGRSRPSRVKTVPVPVPKPRRADLRGLAENVGQAGRQFAKLAGEIQAARRKAEEIGRVIAP